MQLTHPTILEPPITTAIGCVRETTKRLGESRRDSTRQPCASSDVYGTMSKGTQMNSLLCFKECGEWNDLDILCKRVCILSWIHNMDAVEF